MKERGQNPVMDPLIAVVRPHLKFMLVGAAAIIVRNVLSLRSVNQDGQRFSGLHADLMKLPDPATVNARLVQSFVMLSIHPFWSHIGIIARMDQV